MNNPKNGSRSQAIADLIETIDRQIKIAEYLQCDEALSLLRMAKLALQMERHAISGLELKTFCLALANNFSAAETLSPAVVLFGAQDQGARRRENGAVPDKRQRGR